jgi:hypothetical protein
MIKPMRNFSPGFMVEITHQRGSCHADFSETHTETLHGKAYTLGYQKAAKCSDCHGAHDTRKIDYPDSHVGFKKVVQNCQKCHPDANRRFTGYLTHATHHDKQKYPILYFILWAMTSLLIAVFSFFDLHTLLWMPRPFKYLKDSGELKKSVVLKEISWKKLLTIRIFGYAFLIIGITLILLIIYGVLFGYK